MKEVNARKKDALARKILRILRMDRCVELSCTQEEESFNIYAWKASETALLEAERKKAQALMERQRRSFFC